MQVKFNNNLLFIKSLLVALVLFALDSDAHSQVFLPRTYEYDAAGNRVLRKVLELKNLETDTSNNMLADHISYSQENIPKREVAFEEQIGDVSIRVFPNPTQGELTLQCNDSVSGSYEILSQSGQLLQNGRIVSNISHIDFSPFPSGVYLLRLNMKNQSETWKIIKR